ncbi:hypothetical protein GGF37_001544, partial [Kickxella alabastrina]
MVQQIKEDTPINTTFGKILDFAANMCRKWSPAFYLSVSRDGATKFSRARFDTWLAENRNEINWNVLYPDDRCNAKIKSEEEREKVIYTGDAPMKSESSKMLQLKKRMLKLPTPFIVGEEIPDDDIVAIVKKLCLRVNRLELDRLTSHNKFNNMLKFVDKLPGVTQKFKDDHQREIDEELAKLDLGSTDREITGEERAVWRNPRFAAVCPAEKLADLKRVKDEKNRAAVEEMANDGTAQRFEEARRVAPIIKQKVEQIEEEEKEEVRLRLVGGGIADQFSHIPNPTDQEVAESQTVKWLENSAAIRITRDPIQSGVFRVEGGVGSSARKQGDNIFQAFEKDNLQDGNIRAKDKEFERENIRAWKKKQMFMPFKDPSTDPIQNDLCEVIVKVQGKQGIRWIDYFSYFEQVAMIFNNVHAKASDELKKKLDMEEALTWSVEEMDKLTGEYGVRPPNKARLLHAMRKLDMSCKFFEYFAEEEIDIEEFYAIVRDRIRHINRMTNFQVVSTNVSFIDEQSNFRYYCASDEETLRTLVLHQDITGAFGGSDEVPEDYVIMLSTRRFRICALEMGGGANEHQSDYYMTFDAGGERSNCLIECFRFLCGVTKSSEQIRQELGFKQNTLLGNKHIPALEEYFSMDVSVRLDEFDLAKEGEAIILRPRIIYEKEHGGNNLLLFKDNHYSLIFGENVEKMMKGASMVGSAKMSDDVSKLPEKIRRGTKRTVYYFFDYETVWDCQTFKIQPYSFAIIKTDELGRKLDERFEMKDMKTIINYLMAQSFKERDAEKLLIGFNNSRFDNFMLLDLAIHNNADDTSDVFFVNNTILSMKVYGFKVMDLCRMLNMPLARACKSFKCEQQKLLLDHSQVQNMHNQGKLDAYIADNFESIKQYNMMDVLTLAELYFKSKETIKLLCGQDMSEHMTLASMSYKIFKQCNAHIPLPIHGTAERTLVRESVVGGRAQIFRVGEFDTEPLVCIDCVSLYPYVMLNRVFPISEAKPTQEYQHTIMMTSQDIDTLLTYGATVQIEYGFFWDIDVGQLFKTYFSELVHEKQRQDKLKEQGDSEYNGAIRELCKLLMNSLSGKLIQKDYDHVVEIIRSKQELNYFKQQCKTNIKVLDIKDDLCIVAGELQNYTNNTPVVYGALIYSYARSHMYDTILSKVDPMQLFGMDTDSAFITERQYRALQTNSPHIFGDEFGQFKEEILDQVHEHELGPYGIFIAPKCYCFYAKNTITREERFIKARFKGINIKRDKIWTGTREEYKQLDYKQLHQVYYDDDKLAAIDVSFFRRCLTEDVTVLH